jgi:glutamate racemase
LKPHNPIGVFDSGIGGLTVANAIKENLPNEKIIYFGDTQHLPYGNKSSKKINYFSDRIVEFLISKKCKAIVIACNTASSVAIESIIKKVDNQCLVFNVIDPVIRHVVDNKNIKNLGIIGTAATIASNIYQSKINSIRKDIKIQSIATPLLATLIEEDNLNLHGNSIIHSYLSDARLYNIDSLILACTHYPLIELKIKAYYKSKVNIINSVKHIGVMIESTLRIKNLLNPKCTDFKHEFYISDYTDNFQRKTKLFFKSPIILQEENIF